MKMRSSSAAASTRPTGRNSVRRSNLLVSSGEFIRIDQRRLRMRRSSPPSPQASHETDRCGIRRTTSPNNSRREHGLCLDPLVAEDQRKNERRQLERRVTPGQALDVTRLEHESLVTEVMRNASTLRQVEQEVRILRELINRLYLRDMS